MKLILGTSLFDGNLLRMKSGFTFVIFFNLNSDINFKLKNRLDNLINISVFYPKG